MQQNDVQSNVVIFACIKLKKLNFYYYSCFKSSSNPSESNLLFTQVSFFNVLLFIYVHFY